MPSSDLLDRIGIGRDEITVERELVLELGHSYHLLLRWVGAALGRVGLTMQQYGVLELAARSRSGVAQSDLHDLMLCSRPNLSGILDRLVQSGLLVSLPGAADRRRRMLRVTPRGLRLLRRARPAYRNALHEVFTPITPAVRSTLLHLLQEIRITLEASGAGTLDVPGLDGEAGT